MDKIVARIALDTHKKEHTVAWANPETGEIEVFTVKNNAKDIKKMVRRLKKQTDKTLSFCYEAGVCGFNLQRQLEALDCQCDVIAPSLVPVKSGDRIKTDSRDAKKLLEHFEAGQLTKVHPPNPQQEAARELTRCRQAAVENLKRIRQQMLQFLTRNGFAYRIGYHWTKQHLAWLSSLVFAQEDLQQVFAHIYMELQHCQQRVEGLDKELQALAKRPQYRKIVSRLRCFRGIDTIAAIILVTEIFDFGRFQSANALMAYLGLVPSQYSTGDKRVFGAITKTGNGRVRRLLVECAWHYRHRPNIGHRLKQRREGQPQWAIDVADRAMLRLFKRYHHLVNRGKVRQKVAIAIARELAGFIWALTQEHRHYEAA